MQKSKSQLSDTYYNRAHDQRQNALDDEAASYEESLQRYVENLRNTTQEMFSGMVTFSENGTMEFNGFIEGVSQAVIANADTVEAEYKATGLAISDTLLEPWTKAAEKIGTFGGDLAKMNEWTTDTGYFGQFKTNATNQLTAPFNSAKSALTSFQSSVQTVMGNIITGVKSNVTNWTSELGSVKSAYDGITTSANRAKAASDASTTAANNAARAVSAANTNNTTVSATAKLKSGATTFQATRTASSESEAKRLAKNAVIDNAYNYYRSRVNETQLERMYNGWGSKVTYLAKGTTGLKDDNWTITDEPEFGPELSMYATPQGTLSFMRAGSTVVPADLTKELMTIGELGLDGLINMSKFNSGVNIMSNAINKPEIKIDVAEFVHVDTVDQGTMPLLEKMVDKKIDSLVKQMNYAIKGRGAR